MYFALLSQFTKCKNLRTFKGKLLWKKPAIRKLRTFCNSAGLLITYPVSSPECSELARAKKFELGWLCSGSGSNKY